MYHDYFGLDESAFSIAVNPRYLFMSRKHKEALAHLLYGVQGGGFVLLSGEVGTGKTTIIRCLLEQLPERTEIAFVLNPMANVNEMLGTICEELHVDFYEDNPSLKKMMDALQVRLLANHARGKQTVLLIDEAQLLSPDVLEQIRLLTNLETSTEKLLQIVLVGQPEVNELLAQPRLRQLSQRISARFHLQPLSLSETKAYIHHRLHIAGHKGDKDIFPDSIIKRIHLFSGGIPRLINILCERLLIGAYGHNKFQIDNATFKLAAQEVEGAKPVSSTTRLAFLDELPMRWVTIGAGSFVLLICLLFTIKWLFSSGSADLDNNAISTAADTDNNATLNRPAAAPGNTLSPTIPQRRRNDAASTGFASKYSANTHEAYLRLFTYYDLKTDDETHPCWQTDTHRLTCSEVTLKTWQDVELINRPAILNIVTEEKVPAFVTLVGINNDTAFILDKTNTIIKLDKLELGKQWNGETRYLWFKPKGYQKPLAEGMSSQVVTWTAEQFALLDNQSKPLTQKRFTARFKKRIKIFQNSVGLKDDGILGERTLMKLNDELGVTKTLTQFSDKN